MGVWRRNPILGHVVYRLSQAKEPVTRDFEEAKKDVETAVRLEKARLLAFETAKTALTQVEGGENIESLAEKLGLKTETLAFTVNTRFLPGVGDNTEFRKVGLHLNQNQLFGLNLNENRADLIPVSYTHLTLPTICSV